MNLRVLIVSCAAFSACTARDVVAKVGSRELKAADVEARIRSAPMKAEDALEVLILSLIHI